MDNGLSSWLPYPLFFLLPFLIYWDALHGQWQIDDGDGILRYDGKLQHPLRWHHFFRKFRWLIGRVPNPDKDWKKKNLLPYVQSPLKHHRFSLLIYGADLVLLYAFLSYVTTPWTAVLATLLFAVHPVACQVVAWISGIGYLVSFFFMLLGLNFVVLLPSGWTQHPLCMMAAFAGYGVLQWMAIEAQFASAGVTLVLALMGQWPFAIIAGVISLYGLLNTLKDAIALRSKTFREQQMGQTTKFYAKKLIVVIKTYAYYTKLIVFPKRMGMYHTFGYHYELPEMELEDKYFWSGVVLLIASVVGIVLGPFIVKLAIVWHIAFILLFLNWITINQFVTERYVWMPSVGIALLAAWYLPEWVFFILVGIAVMRMWAHIPTYFTEISFYHSNIWNFPTSEVAMGNLGVSFLNQRFIGSAMEIWCLGIKTNPEYDVNWYNLASLVKSRGFPNPYYTERLMELIPPPVVEQAMKQQAKAHLHLSAYLLERAVNARQCHFPEQWKKELQQLKTQLMDLPKPTLVKTMTLPGIA